jgi:HSP20 family molecular chaperone IbpA
MPGPVVVDVDHRHQHGDCTTTITLRFELPGIAADDVEVSLQGTELVVRAEHRPASPVHSAAPGGPHRPRG